MRVDGKLQLFDAEWRVKESVPLLLPVVRGLVSTFGGVEEDVWISKLPYGSLPEVCVALLAAENIPAAPQEMTSCIGLDARIHEAIYPAVAKRSYQNDLEAVFLRDLRAAKLRKSAKALLGAARGFVRNTPVLGPALSSVLSAARK
jgi:hypothetical protein